MSRTALRTKSAPRPVKRANRSLWIGLVAAAVAALALALVMSGGSTPGMPDNARVSVTGAALPAFAGDSFNDPAVGLSAPTLGGEDFGGRQVSVANDGRPKVILFLAHWCPHCQVEVPVLQSYANEVGFPSWFDLYSVATSYTPSRPNWPPSAWLEREKWTFPVMVDDPQSSAFTAFGQGAFPYYVLVDGDGKVGFRFSGELGAEALIATMEQVVGE